jgi:hypothetical protein
MDSRKLHNEIKKTNAPWQFDLEATLLGRELDAGRTDKDSRAEPPASSTSSDGSQ